VRKAHKPIGAERTIPGSISALVASYIELVLPLKAAGTRAGRLGLLNRFRDEHGHRSVAGATPELLETIILKKAKDAPEGANNLRKALRDLFKHVVRIKLRPDNPMLNQNQGGRRRWSDDELAQLAAKQAKRRKNKTGQKFLQPSDPAFLQPLI
jgi:enterobacteria phage integrase